MMTNKDILIHAVDGRFTKFGASSFSALLVILIFVSFRPLVAQGQKVDSLKSLLENEFGPKRQQILFELAYHFTDIDNRLAMDYVNLAAKLSDTFGDSLMIVKCGRILSRRILPIAVRNKFDDEIKRILNGLAMVYSYQANYDKALSAYLSILDSFDPTKNKSEVSVIIHNIGLVYFKLDDLDKALYYFDQSLAIKYQNNDQFDIDMLLINIGLCHAYKGNYATAKEFTDRGLNACKNSCSAQILVMAYFNLGLISYGLKQLSLSENQFLMSYAFAKETDNELYQLDNLIHLFKIYLDTKDLSAAKKLIKDADELLTTSTYYSQGVMQMCGQLTKIYEQLGNISKVAFYQAKYIELKDSVFTEELTKNLMRVEAQFRDRESKGRIDAQTKILALRENVINRQRLLNVIVGLVAFLSIILIFVLIQNVKQKKLANSLLEDKVKERTIELELNHNLLLKTMQERNVQFQRMSSEIRSSLATIKGLGVLVSHDVGTIDASNYLAKIEETSNNLIQGLSRVYSQ
jgi:hypothetical protein